MGTDALRAPVGVVLAGGQSRRMGRDKALLRVQGGATLLDLAVTALRAAGVNEIAISVSTTQRGEALRAAVPAVAGLPIVVDATPNRGPLGGLHAALCAYPDRAVLLVACDMPRLDPAALRLLIAESPDADVVLPCVDGRDQPLHARYGAACRAAAARLLAQGQLAMRDLLAAPELCVTRLDDAALARAGIAAAAFANVNAPADMEILLEPSMGDVKPSDATSGMASPVIHGQPPNDAGAIRG